jgi:hypothetical protein
LITALGAIIGYGYYHFFGCESGCPLKSSWTTMTLYGAVFGFVLSLPTKKKKIK